ncbi:hypothetical protein BDW68DRAFT_174661 [Aspergillus falconensis]
MTNKLTSLPAEVIQIIASYLPNGGIKTLRLTCRTLCDTGRLPAAHKSPPHNRGYIKQLILAEEQAAAELPLKVSWQYYQNLLQQQEETNLQKKGRAGPRIRTPPVSGFQEVDYHGWSFTPLYETPLIRAFPREFNYPTPHGWPSAPINGTYKPTAQPWEDKTVKKDHRGFGITTRALAQYPEHRPNPEYNDFATILRRPGFTSLDLSLHARGQEHSGWPCLRSGCFRRALAGADGLEHMSLSTDV